MEFKAKETGAKVVIAPASLKDAFLLKAAIQRAFLVNKVNPQEALLNDDIFSLIMAVDSSEEIYDGLFNCLKKSTYNDIKITPEIFEDEERRRDLYEVFFYCLKVNIYPFYKSLLSLLKIQSKETTEGEGSQK